MRALPRHRVSVKGVVLLDGGVPLLLNERDEWELPGGKLEYAEQPQACVEREIREELGLLVRAECLLDSWNYEVLPDRYVLILTYGCTLLSGTSAVIRRSTEHREAKLFRPTEADALTMPSGYQRSIRAWCARIAFPNGEANLSAYSRIVAFDCI